MTIKDNVQKILAELPTGVELVAAVKTRSIEEILQAIDGGVKIIGENYIQEAERAYAVIGGRVQWHFIGHLQKNKVKKAVTMFDMIETVDSLDIANEINKRSFDAGEIIPVLVQVNIGGEKQKSGMLPQNIEPLLREIGTLKNIKVMGLMTLGPFFEHAEDSRPYFRQTKILFEHFKGISLPNIEMKYLSMGMTNNYRVAIQEGANVIRIGNKIFGNRRAS